MKRRRPTSWAAQPPSAQGGLLAQTNSNIGDRSRTIFDYIPHLAAELGYQVEPHLRLYGGYDIVYWPQVVRAAEQIDFTVDPGNIPAIAVNPTPPASTSNHPAFQYQEAGYWAQGLHVGAELRY